MFSASPSTSVTRSRLLRGSLLLVLVLLVGLSGSAEVLALVMQ